MMQENRVVADPNASGHRLWNMGPSRSRMAYLVQRWNRMAITSDNSDFRLRSRRLAVRQCAKRGPRYPAVYQSPRRQFARSLDMVAFRTGAGVFLGVAARRLWAEKTTSELPKQSCWRPNALSPVCALVKPLGTKQCCGRVIRTSRMIEMIEIPK